MRSRRALFVSFGFFVASAAARPASAEVEVGGFGGFHHFSPHNALGRESPPSPTGVLQSSVTLGARFTYLPHPRIAGELELAVAPTETQSGSGTVIPSVRASVMANLLTGWIRPYFLLGGAAFVASPSDPVTYKSDVRGAGSAGVGVRVDIGDWWGLRGDGRLFVLPGTDHASIAVDHEFTLGIYGRFPAPPAPEDVGRGPLIADTDHDGVGDHLDKCINDPGPVRNYGCPVEGDRDEDGIIDKLDKCPDLAGPKELDGCPDTDKDGIVDPEDKCPNEPGIPENKGCPDVDTDKDGIVDRLDKCPNEPETKNGLSDDDGCPDELPKAPVPVILPIRNLESIDFGKNSSQLTRASMPVLDAAAEVIKKHPEDNVEILGHTDASGDADHNMRLSLARAVAVRDYLIRRGVSPDRLKATGKGSSEPAAGGTTAERAQRDRRVEFRITESH